MDLLSPPVRAVLEANATAAYTRLVVRGDGSPQTRERLLALGPDWLLAQPVRSIEDARSLLAGLWLWHDWLSESHMISQDIASATGSFWHAIMHRREGDFSNAKYWYARCRHHPVLEQIPALARVTLGDAATTTAPLHRLLSTTGWDPDAFVDVVEATHRNPSDPLYTIAVRLQQLEWRALFEHCARRAAGQ
jgi:hypothetical protein